MNLLAVGLSHHSAPVALLERVSMDRATANALSERLLAAAPIKEVCVLSTCNRVEVYAAATSFHAGLAVIVEELAARAGLSSTDFAEAGYVRYGPEAVRHVFSVACGLDSMVAGEAQILGQLRNAYETAREANHAGRYLHELMQQGLRVGKRVHAETDIDASAPSVVTAAFEAALAKLDRPHSELDVAIVGAGAMGALAAATLHRAPVASVTLLNRDRSKAERLARDYGGRVADYAHLAQVAAEVDLIFSATSSPEPVIAADTLHNRRETLVVCDLAIPRDVADDVARLDDVAVIGIAQLQTEPSASAGTDALAEAETILNEEVDAYLEGMRGDAVTPTVAALRAAAADIVDTEMSRIARRGDFSDEQRAEVAKTVHRVVQRLLHEPTVRVRQLSGQPGAPDYARVLQDLFALNTDSAEQPQGSLADALAVRIEEER
ncbi:glutamyl-tRNA reductase [Natronoglycomyces albus]|uniref:Glutamyl-tRNA reductase n=1 Tax=Natronoglycomyces albus TaxID=2811108 RepID=A0A895XKK4_9ACTN|nr:glutamyl-tRNA reductase [Natronoglycomyces albus]QSB05587.1 glutamyl-tRNA reductase [Natronoglycomyces albus]